MRVMTSIASVIRGCPAVSREARSTIMMSTCVWSIRTTWSGRVTSYAPGVAIRARTKLVSPRRVARANALIDPWQPGLDGSSGGRRKTLLPAGRGDVRDHPLQRWSSRLQILAFQELLDQCVPGRLRVQAALRTPAFALQQDLNGRSSAITQDQLVERGTAETELRRHVFDLPLLKSSVAGPAQPGRPLSQDLAPPARGDDPRSAPLRAARGKAALPGGPVGWRMKSNIPPAAPTLTKAPPDNNCFSLLRPNSLQILGGIIGCGATRA
jgi:hypothetical protein